MTTATQNSVLIALADVIDIERARARKLAERRAAEAAEARRREEEAARRAKEAAEAEARQAREAAERAAREEAALHARTERESRFQALVAERVATIAAEGDREIAALRESYASQPRRRHRGWVTALAVAACLLMVGAVGCLVGSTFTGSQPPAAPALSAKAARPAAPAPAPSEALAWASALEHPLAADPTLRGGWRYAPKHTTWRPRPQPTTPVASTPTVSCSKLGALGCLVD